MNISPLLVHIQHRGTLAAGKAGKRYLVWLLLEINISVHRRLLHHMLATDSDVVRVIRRVSRLIGLVMDAVVI